MWAPTLRCQETAPALHGMGPCYSAFSVTASAPFAQWAGRTPQSPSSSLPLRCSAARPFTGPGIRILAPDPGLTRQVNDEPAVHFILLGDEGSGAFGVLGGRGSTEEEAGEALEHGRG